MSASPEPGALDSHDWSLDAASVAAAEEERSAVLERFPRDGWASLALTDYALGQSDHTETWCRWMEYKTPHLGSIKGGAATKHLIYQLRNGEGWYYDPAFADVGAAWSAVRDGFVAALDRAAHGDWAGIEDIAALRSGQALLVKTLHVYFPADIVPIFSRAHLRHFLEQLDRPEAADRTAGAVTLNRALLDALKSSPGGAGRSTVELMYALYRRLPPPGQQTNQMVKIAPGANAENWTECRAGGYISLGWEHVADLTTFTEFDEFRTAFVEHYPYHGNESTVTVKSRELWRLTELEEGDLVVANQGTREVLAVGTVRAPGYVYRHDLSWPHTVVVDWDDRYRKSIPRQGRWATRTVDDVPAKLRALILGTDDEVVLDADQDALVTRIAESLERKKQAILFGPPGTGKTFHANRFAARWLRRNEPELTEEDLVRPGAHGVGRLTRVTFHPSYSYEDFVEGFRPVSDATATGGLTLRLTDGIFKRVCRAAASDPGHDWLLLIDEINRANVSKVLGELITLLERDKRGQTIVLSQSGDTFAVPANVYVLGTMNTADRSIRLLDVALRRRFAFVELMPDLDRIAGAIETLKLDELLGELNRKLVPLVGRDKQIGHAYFMSDQGEPLTDPVEFQRVVCDDVLPLLQEYCYDQWDVLADLLGPDVVDPEARTFRPETISDPQRLIDALTRRFAVSVAAEAD